MVHVSGCLDYQLMLIVNPPQTAIAYDYRVAVLFGFEKYEQGEGKGIFRNLPFTTNDLESVGNALSEIGFDDIYIFSDTAAPTKSKLTYRLITPNKSKLEETIENFLVAYALERGQVLQSHSRLLRPLELPTHRRVKTQWTRHGAGRLAARLCDCQT